MAGCALLSLLPPQHPAALAVLVPLLVGAWLTYRDPRVAGVWPYAAALLVSASLPSTGGAMSPLLPYLLAPGLTLGLVAGGRQVFLVTVVATCGLLAGGGLAGTLDDSDFTTAGATWILLGQAIGLAAAWATSLVGPPPRSPEEYQRVHALLQQLHSATRQLPGGLDAAAAAEKLLDRFAEVVASSRSAVLVQPAHGALVPLAVRGASRVPWRTPLDEAGPLRDAWASSCPVLDVREGDVGGRRAGSALVVVPLLAQGGPFGLVILESFDTTAFPRAVLLELADCASELALQLEASMLFQEVRAAASVEERDRLARDMHDGVAQELAYVGYQLDDLRIRAMKVDPDLGSRVLEVREQTTRLISDIRLSITDLQTGISPDRGPGAVLSSYLRAVCSGKDIALHLSLEESRFRLPSDQEVLLVSLTHVFAQQLRRSHQARNLWVNLEIDPPSARLQLEHDGADVEGNGLESITASLVQKGANVAICKGQSGGPKVEVALLGEAHDGDSAVGRRPRLDQAGSAPRLRGDRRPRGGSRGVERR